MPGPYVSQGRRWDVKQSAFRLGLSFLKVI